MSWTPPIRCTGRRYPNAPPITRVGCLERPPPYWFLIFSTGNTWWPPVNLTLPIRWKETLSTSSGYDPVNAWQFLFPHAGTTPFTIDVRTERATVGFALHLTIFKSGIVNNFGGQFRKLYPDGFPAWPTSINLPLFASTGTWPGGVPDSFQLHIGHYTQINPGSCVVP